MKVFQSIKNEGKDFFQENKKCFFNLTYILHSQIKK